jgi:hypothetical protein
MGPKKENRTRERKTRADGVAVYIQILDERRTSSRAKPQYLIDWLDQSPSWVASVKSGVEGHAEVLRDWHSYRSAGGVVPRPRASQETRRLFRRAPTVRGCVSHEWVLSHTLQPVDDPAVYVAEENVFVPKSYLDANTWRKATEDIDASFRLPPRYRCSTENARGVTGRVGAREGEVVTESDERETIVVQRRKQDEADARARLLSEADARARLLSESKIELVAENERKRRVGSREKRERLAVAVATATAEKEREREEEEEEEERRAVAKRTEAEVAPSHRIEVTRGAQLGEERDAHDAKVELSTVASPVSCKSTEKHPYMRLGMFSTSEALYHGSPVGFAAPYLPRGPDPRFTTSLAMATYYATKSRVGNGFVYEYKLTKPIPNVIHVCGTWSKISSAYLDFLHDNGVSTSTARFTEDATGKRIWNRIAGNVDLLQSCKLWSGVWVPSYESQLFMCGHLVPAYFALVAIYAVDKQGKRERIDPHTNRNYIRKIVSNVVVRNYGYGV